MYSGLMAKNPHREISPAKETIKRLIVFFAAKHGGISRRKSNFRGEISPCFAAKFAF